MNTKELKSDEVAFLRKGNRWSETRELPDPDKTHFSIDIEEEPSRHYPPVYKTLEDFVRHGSKVLHLHSSELKEEQTFAIIGLKNRRVR